MWELFNPIFTSLIRLANLSLTHPPRPPPSHPLALSQEIVLRPLPLPETLFLVLVLLLLSTLTSGKSPLSFLLDHAAESGPEDSQLPLTFEKSHYSLTLFVSLTLQLDLRSRSPTL